jgi:hypothetical protein
MTNTQPVPTRAISRPATAGPIIRAPLNEAEFSASALESRSSPTISDTKDWRAGASNALAQPSSSAKT